MAEASIAAEAQDLRLDKLVLQDSASKNYCTRNPPGALGGVRSPSSKRKDQTENHRTPARSAPQVHATPIWSSADAGESCFQALRPRRGGCLGISRTRGKGSARQRPPRQYKGNVPHAVHERNGYQLREPREMFQNQPTVEHGDHRRPSHQGYFHFPPSCAAFAPWSRQSVPIASMRVRGMTVR